MHNSLTIGQNIQWEETHISEAQVSDLEFLVLDQLLNGLPVDEGETEICLKLENICLWIVFNCVPEFYAK